MVENPYTSPESSETPTPPVHPATEIWSDSYESAKYRGQLASSAIAMAAVFSVVSVGLFLKRISLLKQLAVGTRYASDAMAELDKAERILSTFDLALKLVCVIVFLAWLKKAYRNLAWMGIDSASFTPGWVVGYWFIPIVNLVRPFQAVKELWLASDPNLLGEDRWREATATARIGVWWAFWLASTVLFGLATSTLESSQPGGGWTVSSIQQSVGSLLAFAEAIRVVCAILIITLILDISKNQDERAALIEAETMDEAEPQAT